MKLIASGREKEFLTRIVLPSAPGEEQQVLSTQGNMLSQGKENSKAGISNSVPSLSSMYVSKSLNTPRQLKKPVIPDSPKNRSKKKSPRP